MAQHNISGIITHEGIEYGYNATVWTGTDAYQYPDTLHDLYPTDTGQSLEYDTPIWDAVEAVVLDDANERARNDS